MHFVAALVIPEEPGSGKDDKDKYDNIYYTVHKNDDE